MHMTHSVQISEFVVLGFLSCCELHIVFTHCGVSAACNVGDSKDFVF